MREENKAKTSYTARILENSNSSEGNFNQIKDYLAEYINSFEMKNHQLFLHQSSDFRERIDRLEKLCDDYQVRINSISEDTQYSKNKADQVADLITNFRKTNDQVMSLDIRVNSLQKEFSNACYKYDKIYLDNLNLPGIIGEFCRYKNLKEYLDVCYYFFFFIFILYTLLIIYI